MITLQDFSRTLDEIFQPGLFNDYCPNGLQVEGAQEITSFATAVSASLETIRRAAESGVQALVVHHGMFWKGDPYPVTGTKREKLQLLLDHDMSLFAYHLPMDAHQTLGNNWAAAIDMGWKALQPFGEYNGQMIGVQGQLEEACSVEAVHEMLSEYYQHPVHAAPGGRSLIRKLALISGGAHKSISEAAAEGVDLFITGSFDEPVWHIAAEEGIHFCALGHSATERVGPRALGMHLAQELGLPHHFIDVPNPF